MCHIHQSKQWLLRRLRAFVRACVCLLFSPELFFIVVYDYRFSIIIILTLFTSFCWKNFILSLSLSSWSSSKLCSMCLLLFRSITQLCQCIGMIKLFSRFDIDWLMLCRAFVDYKYDWWARYFKRCFHFVLIAAVWQRAYAFYFDYSFCSLFLHFTTSDWVYFSKKSASIWNRIVGIARKSGKKRIKIYH